MFFSVARILDLLDIMLEDFWFLFCKKLLDIFFGILLAGSSGSLIDGDSPVSAINLALSTFHFVNCTISSSILPFSRN